MKNGRGIKTKITSLVIWVALLSLLIAAIVSIGGMWYIRDTSLKNNDTLGETASGDAKLALQSQMMERLSENARSMGQISDEKLLAIQTASNMVAAAASDIIDHAANYVPAAPTAPSADNDGVNAFQCLFPEGFDIGPVRQQAELMTNIKGTLMRIAEANPQVTSCYIGTEDGFFYAVDKNSGVKAAFAEPRERPWYKAAKEQNEQIWTDVVDDQFGRGLGIVCATPFYDASGALRGVAGIGTLLTPLSELILGTKIGETGYAFMLNENGQLILHPGIERDADGKLIRPNYLQSENAQLRAATEKMVAGEAGVEEIALDDRDVYIAYEPMRIRPWTIVTVADRDEALKPATDSQQRIMDMADRSASVINQAILMTILLIGAVILITILLTVWISVKFSRRLTKPIEELKDGVETISGGNLDHRISINTGDEIEVLGGSVNKMAGDLKDYIANLQKVTGEKERIGAELNVATKIQASMLPCIFPAFPEREEFDIYATMLPAKEVGGDFYDFFLIDDDKLCVVMADVSGKGVPAALFMVIAKTLIKNNAQYGKSPKEVFETVNNLLCENNEAGMFVTAFMGYLTISTGEFVYVNAGHNPPLVRRKEGRFTMLEMKPGFVLAGMEGMRYREMSTVLAPGDELVLYTDGVTEAVNQREELFGDPRLLDVASGCPRGDVNGMLPRIKLAVDQFANGAEQADDITMLAVMRK